eukprot:CAMPEP_0119375188 /NCGR_PEP_ID=MMETSP1334-20130426/34159_1 /TAXON_ID=127549 /ORGANISM="Calcidiscus leptoporus, Strain RCC1130" /LENGTH=108 /DNA_ID=CAMNT_0007393427 /DNA_START=305 /DNA_END=631 /DNA_ORIENTATION=-
MSTPHQVYIDRGISASMSAHDDVTPPNGLSSLRQKEALELMRLARRVLVWCSCQNFLRLLELGLVAKGFEIFEVVEDVAGCKPALARTEGDLYTLDAWDATTDLGEVR